MNKQGNPYRAGLVGAGEISKSHIEGVRRHPECMNIAALCDPDRNTAQKCAADYKIEHTYSNLEDMLARENLDVAIVCTPTHVRKPVVLPLLKAKIPVFCEKPFAETYAEAKELEQAARAAGVAVAVNQNFRRHFAFSIGREVLAAGHLGRPLHLIQAVTRLRQDKGWRLERKRYVMAIMSIHWFDGYRYLLQDEPGEVYCRGINSPATDGGEDTAVSVILNFKKGTLVSLSESFSSFTKPACCGLDCETGGLQLSYASATEIRADGQRIEHKNTVDKPEAAYWLLNNLMEAVENGGEPETSAADNLKSMRILEAAYLSAEKNRPVKLEEVS